MSLPQIVLDTNILVAGLRSQRGASFRLLSLVGRGRFEINLSVPLVMEYEEVLGREVAGRHVPHSVVDAVLDFHCDAARCHRVFFLWRPTLRDSDDDMVLELAVAAGCTRFVTRDFSGVDRFGVHAVTPGTFLHEIGDQP
jgi:putative PIN family toxin of toxin-antitoxin system